MAPLVNNCFFPFNSESQIKLKTRLGFGTKKTQRPNDSTWLTSSHKTIFYGKTVAAVIMPFWEQFLS